MDLSVLVRPETGGDIEAIRSVHRRAFPTDAEARLVDDLRVAGRLFISLVAVADNEIIGHAALSPVTVEGTQVGLGLAPVALVPEHQRRGIGSELVRRSLDRCREAGVALVVVLGAPSYYSRFGFVAASQLGLSDTYEGGDAFQAILLTTDAPPAAGIVRYAPEFDMLS